MGDILAIPLGSKSHYDLSLQSGDMLDSHWEMNITSLCEAGASSNVTHVMAITPTSQDSLPGHLPIGLNWHPH